MLPRQCTSLIASTPNEKETQRAKTRIHIMLNYLLQATTVALTISTACKAFVKTTAFGAIALCPTDHSCCPGLIKRSGMQKTFNVVLMRARRALCVLPILSWAGSIHQKLRTRQCASSGVHTGCPELPILENSNTHLIFSLRRECRAQARDSDEFRTNH